MVSCWPISAVRHKIASLIAAHRVTTCGIVEVTVILLVFPLDSGLRAMRKALALSHRAQVFIYNDDKDVAARLS